MAKIQKALSKLMDKLDKSRTIDKEAVKRIEANNKAAQEAKKQG